MSRKTKPCWFCSCETESEYIEHKNGYCIWYEVNPLEKRLTFMAQANDEDGDLTEDGIDIEMNYCPVCGRRLTDA